MKNIYTLENDFFRISAKSFGAELCSFYSKDIQSELLWQADEKYWARHAPILFPIVGKLPNNTLKIGDQSYIMTQHGFARDAGFSLIDSSDNKLIFELTHNKQSLRQFPFEFNLQIHYELSNEALLCQYIVTNSGKNALPFSIGAHPAFAWPLLSELDKSAHFIKFLSSKKSQLISNNSIPKQLFRLSDGLLNIEADNCLQINNKIELDDALFTNDAMIFKSIQHKIVRYQAADLAYIEIRFEDFADFGIWTKPGASFICLEPWNGYSSPINFDGDFTTKPGIIILAPESHRSFSYQIKFSQSCNIH